MIEKEGSVSAMMNIERLGARLQVGQQWLARQHGRWVLGDPKAATDEQFSRALAGWDALERVFRCAQPSGCIWGPGKFCSTDAVALCDGCVGGVQSQSRLL